MEGMIPAAPYEMLAFEVGAEAGESIMLGGFNELSGCQADPHPKLPLLGKHLFFLPEKDRIVTLNSEGTTLYDRSLKTQSLLDKQMNGSFVLASGGPGGVWRGQKLSYQVAVGGVKDPEFSLMEGPESASISKEGVFEWLCPSDWAEPKVVARVGVKDPASSRALEKVIELEVQGVSPTRAVKDGENGVGRVLPLRITSVPHQGVIRDKVEVDGGRMQVMVTEGPDEEFRLEVFDGKAEKWLEGVPLPARPDTFVANPKVVYLVYGEQGVMELRSMEDLGKAKRVTLQLPIAGIGCGSDTTEGVLCIAERLDPEKTKVGEFTDWDGSRVTLSTSSSRHVRLVFLSPTSLKPLPITGSEEELAQVTFFMPRQKDAGPVRFGFSPNGLLMTLNNYAIDFGMGQGPIKTAVHRLGNEPLFITEDGRSLYSMNTSPRWDLTDKLQENRQVFEEVKLNFERNVVVRPVPGKDLDVGVAMSRGTGADDRIMAEFRRRTDGALVMTVGPLPELEGLDLIHGEYALQGRKLSVYGNKIVTMGHRKRLLFVRDYVEP